MRSAEDKTGRTTQVLYVLDIPRDTVASTIEDDNGRPAHGRSSRESGPLNYYKLQVCSTLLFLTCLLKSKFELGKIKFPPIQIYEDNKHM